MDSVAHLSLSVDVDGSFSPQAQGHSQAAERALNKLFALATEHHIPLTWAAADPTVLATSRPWSQLPSSHEWALLADRSWAGAGVERFTRELKTRLHQAADAGLAVHSLALGDSQSREFTDQLVKAQIQVVRTQGAPSARLAGGFAAPSHRLGVLRVPTLARLPFHSTWGWRSSNRSLRRLLSAAIEEGASVHWVIDARRLVTSGDTSLRQLGRLFADANAARQQQTLRVSTLGGLAAVARPQATRRQAHSILRAA